MLWKLSDGISYNKSVLHKIVKMSWRIQTYWGHLYLVYQKGTMVQASTGYSSKTLLQEKYKGQM